MIHFFWYVEEQQYNLFYVTSLIFQKQPWG